LHRIFLLIVALMLALLSAPPALAIAPPAINTEAVPPDVTGPDQPLEQRRICAAPTTLPDSNFEDPPWNRCGRLAARTGRTRW
jgi:membrane-anchored mycosin MYCP